MDLCANFYKFELYCSFQFWLFQVSSSLMFGWLLQMFKDLLAFKFFTLIYIWYLFGGLLQWILIILLGLFVAFCLKLKIAAPMVVVSNHGPLFTNCIASCYFCFLSLSLVGFVAPMLALLYVMFVYWFCSQLFYLFSSALFHNCLTLSFWVFVPSIFVMTLHSLTVPIIATIGPFFYLTI